ncbi:thioredoxin domain containing protein [Saprospira grandis DSM 2844]|uniref:Thioredoxin domain containing protein n=1 Tax=Saprospira grandis DSM 2844 TaxID=694433 RepID=J0P809_9BACT|nr:thioredoxin domain-containing protein [Saprospira grandis]EJF53662.1 thioredoxin domain containing protein [Saprospira grandis DSM 2844]
MKYSNRLQKESSPYLQQHAHNPVDWYPWGQEALDKAKAENKMILLSIGYSTCHWCHVMEKESFEDPRVGEFMNQHFVSIKVDREERPDLDHIYMEAVQLVTGGQGGWPLNCFLLPNGRPFFGGTYFPPRRMQNRNSWMEVLGNLSKVWQEQPQTIIDQADKLYNFLQKGEDKMTEGIDFGQNGDSPFKTSDWNYCLDQLADNFDEQAGGFGHSPKFPSVMSLRYLLNSYYHEKDQKSMQQLQFSLDAMIYGGIYDLLGGGFARYTVDRYWKIPHFEKMLYDNALLIGLLADTYKLTQKPVYAQTIAECWNWLQSEMQSPEGTYYSALDADSEGEEGKFYVWNWEKLQNALANWPQPWKQIFLDFYDASPAGNWEGKIILRRPQSLAGFAQSRKLDPKELQQELDKIKAHLLDIRAQRIRPGRDEKIILSWNALLATALLKAYQAIRLPEYKKAAFGILEQIEKRLQNEKGQLLHSYAGQKIAPQLAFSDDYAFLIEAQLLAYEISFEEKHLQQADHLMQACITDYSAEAGLFYYSSAQQTDILYRKKDLYDSATPSGNSSLMHNLEQLGILLDKAEYRERAAQMAAAMRKSIRKYPQSFGRWANFLFKILYPTKEVAIVGPEFANWAAEMQSQFAPNLIYAATPKQSSLPLLLGREQTDGKSKIFICENYACQLPVDSVAEAWTKIKNK